MTGYESLNERRALISSRTTFAGVVCVGHEKSLLCCCQLGICQDYQQILVGTVCISESLAVVHRKNILWLWARFTEMSCNNRTIILQ